MDDLVATIRAGLDKDEAYARQPELWKEYQRGDPNDPERVLAEVAAKRQLIAEYEAEQRVMARGHRTPWTEGGQAAREQVLRHFAQMYG